jgi:hypothetical protein
MLAAMPRRHALFPAIGGQTYGDCLDEVIAELAERQHGLVSRRQLLDAGLGKHAIDHRISRGRLHPVYRGVYAVGHTNVTPDGRRMAAVLAAGPGAVCSHRCAGAHWEIWRSEFIEVTLDRRRRQMHRVRVHVLPLPADEVTIERGVPVTIVPRTIFDMAAVLPLRHVERAMNEAELRKLFHPLSLPDLLERYPFRRGATVIRTILEAGLVLTRSDLEAAFVELVDEFGFQHPEYNAAMFVAGHWIECDCVWRAQRVIVELDGRAVHGTAIAFERDRARDRMLQAAGWRVIRVTARQLRGDRDRLAYELRAILSSSAGNAPSRRTSQVASLS